MRQRAGIHRALYGTLGALVFAASIVHSQEAPNINFAVRPGALTMGSVDQVKANGIFVAIDVQVTSGAGPEVFSTSGYTLTDTMGRTISVTKNDLDAMEHLKQGSGGNVTLQPGVPREFYLVFDVPALGVYHLSGPGIQGSIRVPVN
jgi:hypothetical protein